MTLAHRSHQLELMDDPHLDAVVHQRALKALKRINAFSLSSQIVWPVLRELARVEPQRPLRVLDLACGGGDVVCRLGRWAQQAKLKIEWLGWDRSDVAIQVAQETATRSGITAEFVVRDVLQDELPVDCDVIMCSLFLHHLSETDAVELLRKMTTAARRTALVNDLRRTRLGYVLAHLACRLLTWSPIVRVDGPRSVAGAFTEQEVLLLAARAGYKDPQLSRHWPQRYLLRCDRR